ncbi:uncharacterized protein LOC119071078 [Bradysia coprophila]|uniref:uncharacterized protein LOC119071078 n=1 Tax=Bradysia coprophila TaxID=38358 RepID=UPI00187D77C4|nr:uncharacterized protein LOC119071078 [Bradysia coprophila]
MLDSYAIRGSQSNRIKSIQAIAAVEKAMKKYGIPKPPKGQRSRLHHDLPKDPEEKEAEVLKRFKYSNLHSKAGNEIAQKLNDLLVYAETGKSLKSDLIALAVLSRLESFEKEVKESQRTVLATQKDLLSRRNFSSEFGKQLLKKRKSVTKRDRRLVEDLKIHEERGFLRRMAVPLEHGNLYSNSPLPIKRPRQTIKSSLWRNINLYSAKVNAKVREDIDKYKQFGSAKKQLYSMPQYFAYREQKGIKLPANQINGQPKNKDGIKVRDNETRMGRVVAREMAEIKKMEKLNQRLIQLNPLRYRPNSV